MKKIILLFFLCCFSKTFLIAQYWSAVGTGVGPNSFNAVYSFATYNNELYAAGNFRTAGGVSANNIAKWNGSNWSALGSGLNDAVYSLGVYNGELYAVGSFNIAGGILANRIAKWNGTNWSVVGSVNGSGFQSLAVYGGELYAAGYFPDLGGPDGTSTAKWNGINWSAVGTGVEPVINSVKCLTVYNGELYAAGADIGGGGAPNSFSILKWNGLTWNTLITQPAGYTYDGAFGEFLSMGVFNGELYVAGNFAMTIDTINNIIAYQIAKWNGTDWSVVGSGINPAAYPIGGDSDGSTYSFVGSLAVHEGALYAGGHFDSCGIVATRNIAKWDGTNWSALGQGVNGFVFSMVDAYSYLFVGGLFNHVNSNLPVNKIAKWGASCNLPRPGIINGNVVICEGSSQTYSIDTVAGAHNYTWTLPSGWTGSSTTNIISVTAGANSGIISVTANDHCGSSPAQVLQVTINTIPATPSMIIGSDTVCEGGSQTYWINPVMGATGYSWDLSFGWTGGMHDDSITVTVGQPSQVDHIISVSAYNNCGNSDLQSLPVFIKPLPSLDNITGNVKVCRGSIQTYTTYPYPNTIFTWILPSGWIGSSTSNSITVIVGDTAGKISVRAKTDCGISDYKTLDVLIDSDLLKPAGINGNTYVYIDEIIDYSVDSIPSADSYKWSVSGGGTIINDHNINNVSVKWKSPGRYFLSVNATNTCGRSADQSIAVIVADKAREDSFDIRMFPNPSQGEFYVSAKRAEGKLISAEVLNMEGRIIYRSGKLPGSNNYLKLINLKKFSQGVYVVKIIVDNTIYIRRLMRIE